MSDREIQQLKRSAESPEDYQKLARQMCRAGNHAYTNGASSSKYLGHSFSGRKLAVHLGMIEEGSLPGTWCEEEQCFFCGKTVRYLTVDDITYKFEL
jgi:hypothetical protein